MNTQIDINITINEYGHNTIALVPKDKLLNGSLSNNEIQSLDKLFKFNVEESPFKDQLPNTVCYMSTPQSKCKLISDKNLKLICEETKKFFEGQSKISKNLEVIEVIYLKIFISKYSNESLKEFNFYVSEFLRLSERNRIFRAKDIDIDDLNQYKKVQVRRRKLMQENKIIFKKNQIPLILMRNQLMNTIKKLSKIDPSGRNVFFMPKGREKFYTNKLHKTQNLPFIFREMFTDLSKAAVYTKEYKNKEILICKSDSIVDLSVFSTNKNCSLCLSSKVFKVIGVIHFHEEWDYKDLQDQVGIDIIKKSKEFNHSMKIVCEFVGTYFSDQESEKIKTLIMKYYLKSNTFLSYAKEETVAVEK